MHSVWLGSCHGVLILFSVVNILTDPVLFSTDQEFEFHFCSRLVSKAIEPTAPALTFDDLPPPGSISFFWSHAHRSTIDWRTLSHFIGRLK